MTKKLTILYTDAGGGHKHAALALQEIFSKDPKWQVELINPFQEFNAHIDLIKKITGISGEDMYNKLIIGNDYSIFGLVFVSIIYKLNLMLYSKRIVKRFSKAWSDLQPNVIISVTPFINQHVQLSVTAHDELSFCTLITDYSECIKNAWIGSNSSNIICATDKLVQQALQRGVLRQHIFKISGMIVSPKFYEVKSADIATLKNKLGILPNLATGIIMFGINGTIDMIRIAKNLQACDLPVQLVFICGYDKKTKAALQNLQLTYPAIILGYIDNVHEYMHCADFFIGKPGGISITEAMISNLPMILKYNIFTLPQERYNARWVVEHKLGVTVKNFNNIKKETAKLLNNLPAYKRNFEQINNRGIYEVPTIIEGFYNLRDLE